MMHRLAPKNLKYLFMDTRSDLSRSYFLSSETETMVCKVLGTVKISHFIMDVLNITVSLFNQCFNAFFF